MFYTIPANSILFNKLSKLLSYCFLINLFCDRIDSINLPFFGAYSPKLYSYYHVNFPVNISSKTQPAAQISELFPFPCIPYPLSIYGDI